MSSLWLTIFALSSYLLLDIAATPLETHPQHEGNSSSLVKRGDVGLLNADLISESMPWIQVCLTDRVLDYSADADIAQFTRTGYCTEDQLRDWDCR